jgi:hypothetical protein
MSADFIPSRDYHAARERADLSARKQAQEANRDEEIEQAVVAFVNYRQNGGDKMWEQYRQEWITDRNKEGADGG